MFSHCLSPTQSLPLCLEKWIPTLGMTMKWQSVPQPFLLCIWAELHGSHHRAQHKYLFLIHLTTKINPHKTNFHHVLLGVVLLHHSLPGYCYIFFLELKLQLKGTKMPRVPAVQHTVTFISKYLGLSSSSLVLVTKPVMRTGNCKTNSFP